MPKYNFSQNKCLPEDIECEEIIKTSCIEYDGEDLSTFGIKKGDSMNTVIYKIDKGFNDMLIRIKDIDFTIGIDCNKLEE